MAGSPPNTLEHMLDHFARHASTAEKSKMDGARSFEQGLAVLRRYARNRFNIRTEEWKELMHWSLRNCELRPQDTVEDLWRFMFYRIDLDREPPFLTAGPPSTKLQYYAEFEIPTIPGPRRVRGFGKIAPVHRRFVSASRNNALNASKEVYFRLSKGKTYKARLRHKRVIFVKYGLGAAALRALRAINSISFYEWGVGFSLPKYDEPHNYLFTKVCSEGTTEMIDWAVARMCSYDINISVTSREHTTCIPCSTVDRHHGMCLSAPIRKQYFLKKLFWYQRRTGKIFWNPNDGRYLMEVVINKYAFHNSFKRVKENHVLRRGSLRACRVVDFKRFK